MENINNKIKKKQIILFSAVAFGILLIILIGIIYFRLQNGDIKLSNEKNEKKEIPQLVGVVNHTFDEKYTANALKDNQTLGRELDRKYDSLQNELKRKNQEIINLQQELTLQQENLKTITDNYDKRLNDLEKRKSGNNYNIDVGDVRNSKSGSNQINSESEIEGYGELARPAPTIVTTRVNSEFLEEKSDLPYIPSGSFAEAIIIEGADANASVTGNNNTDPIQFRIIGKVQMPNDQEYDLTGCFITAEVYGDISSERGKVRTRTISCKSENEDEKTIDMKIKGHVAYAGKNGIKGTPVMRNGSIVAWAGAAGLLDGFGKGAESASGKTVGIGATSDVGGGDILKSALGGGVSKASSTLSDYYIKRAEQYHPVIDIGAGNLVTIVFQDGFQLEYKEDQLNKENNKNSSNVNKNDLLSPAEPYNSRLFSIKKQPFNQTSNTPPTNIKNEEDNEDTKINLNDDQSIDNLKDIYLEDYIQKENSDD